MPGTPLALRLTVVNASTCKPIKGAAVDIWHADAAGAYSGEQSNGTVGRTFMRGIQRTDARGLARFDTVYPGWYTGRTVHIHVKVHVGGNVIHTGQLFFNDALDRRRVQEGAVQRPPGARRAQRAGLDLPERWKQIRPEGAQERRRVRRRDQHGRSHQLELVAIESGAMCRDS